jgi:predicted RNA-binding protein
MGEEVKEEKDVTEQVPIGNKRVRGVQQHGRTSLLNIHRTKVSRCIILSAVHLPSFFSPLTESRHIIDMNWYAGSSHFET